MVAGYVSLLCSISDKPLEYWSKQQSQSGRVRKILDSDLLENVIEIQDFEQPNSHGTSIICPTNSSQVLNIELPILVVVIKNVNLHCRLQVQVADTENCLHHFQFTNAEAEKQNNSRGVICRAKIKLDTGWNKLELNMSNLTQTAFKRQYSTTQRIQISGNCRLRRIYFIDRHYEQQEICPKLYHGFLDSYMQKWGIHTIDRSSQTCTKRNKSRVRGNGSVKKSSTENLSEDEILKSATGRKTAEENFLKNLQLKTDILINNFFDRRSKLPRALELKQNAKLKPYALPLVTGNSRPSNPGVISEDALKRINILKTFTDSYVSHDHKRKEDNSVDNIGEDWKYRYLLPRDRYSKSSDVTKPNVKRTMLEFKPKSLQLLPEMKSASVKSTNLEPLKRNGEIT